MSTFRRIIKTTLLFVVVGPIVGAVAFFGVLGVDPADRLVLPYSLLGGAFVGIPSALAAGLMFCPSYWAFQKLFVQRPLQLSVAITALLAGSTVGCVSLAGFLVLTAQRISGVGFLFSEPAMVAVALLPGGVCGVLASVCYKDRVSDSGIRANAKQL